MSEKESKHLFVSPTIRIEEGIASFQDDPQREAVPCTSPVNKRAKVYPIPVRDDFEFEITIKILQTSRQQKNKLSLSRDVLETIIGSVSNLVFLENNTNILSSEEENPDSEYNMSARGLLQLLCYHVLCMYEKVNNTNTSGIWDVSKVTI